MTDQVLRGAPRGSLQYQCFSAGVDGPRRRSPRLLSLNIKCGPKIILGTVFRGPPIVPKTSSEVRHCSEVFSPTIMHSSRYKYECPADRTGASYKHHGLCYHDQRGEGIWTKEI